MHAKHFGTTDHPEGVNQLQGRVFPSSERRGGCAVKKMLRSLLIKAQTGWSVPDNVTTSTFTIMTTPSAPLRRLRAFFLLAQPPLLSQEGNTLSCQFIHTFPVCAFKGGCLFLNGAATPPVPGGEYT